MVTIGFSGTYSVREDAGSISVVVLVLMKSLGRDVAVILSTLDNTARGGFTQHIQLSWITIDHFSIFSCMQLGLITLLYLEI